jgi:hypothetical protein
MKKQNFDQGWEYTEAVGFAAMFNPQVWQPVTLPHDAMIGKPLLDLPWPGVLCR